jgi:hypothetical protein
MEAYPSRISRQSALDGTVLFRPYISHANSPAGAIINAPRISAVYTTRAGCGYFYFAPELRRS